MANIFEVKNERNYAAEVVKVERLVDLDGLDNLKGLPIGGGYVALVGKDTPIGSLMVVFPAEAQLSFDFAHLNNLHRDTTLNADQTKAGYLEKNRRVKALRLRGHASNALAIEVEALWNITSHLPEPGTVFDTINGTEISRKYEVPTPKGANQKAQQMAKLWRRADKKFMPEHFDTLQLWRAEDRFDPNDFVTVTQKLHGTSVRIGRTIVKRKLNWFERLLVKVGVPVKDTETDILGGSRKVIKDPESTTQDHWYDSDIWTREALKYAGLIPEHVIVYGELIGYVDGSGKEIQSGYTYNVPFGQTHLYVYRVAVVAPDGGLYDLSWEGVKEFCQERGLNHVPEVWSGYFSRFEPKVWQDLRIADISGYGNPLPLSKKGTVDEGVCIRKEGVIPFVAKSKSPKFFEWESAALDQGEEILS